MKFIIESADERTDDQHRPDKARIATFEDGDLDAEFFIDQAEIEQWGRSLQDPDTLRELADVLDKLPTHA